MSVTNIKTIAADLAYELEPVVKGSRKSGHFCDYRSKVQMAYDRARKIVELAREIEQRAADQPGESP